MLALGYDICHLFSGHQIVYALHMDSAHCHLHFVVNSVSFEDGKKHFSGFHDLFPVRDFLQECFPRSNVHIYQSFPDSVLTASDAPTMTNCCGSIKTAKEL